MHRYGRQRKSKRGRANIHIKPADDPNWASQKKSNHTREFTEGKYFVKTFLGLAGGGTSGGGTQAGEIQELSGVPVGNTAITRVGNKIKATSLQFRWWVQAQTDAADAPPGQIEALRVIIFQYHGLTAPTTGLPLLDDTVPVANVLLRFYNQDQAQAYKIIFDQSVTVAKTAALAAGENNHTMGNQIPSFTQMKSVKIPIPEQNIQFQTGGVEGTNKLYMATFSSTNTVGDVPFLYASSKLNFSG